MSNAKPTFEIRGWEDIEKNLRKSVKAVGQKPLEDIVLNKAEDIKKEAQRRAPVLTGKLKRDIRAKITKSMPTRVIAEIGHSLGIGKNKVIFYAHMQEFGTVHFAGQPYMRPAFDKFKRSAPQEMGRKYWLEISKAVKTSGRKI